MICVFFAQGFEEVEGITVVDVLRRAKLDVLTIGVESGCVTGAHGISVICDDEITRVTPNDKIEAIILPGGMPGTTNLEKSPKVQAMIDYAAMKNILIGAICAAPIILGHKGLLKVRNATCFPGFEKELIGAQLSEELVCTDGNIITAKGMGVSIDFSVEIVKQLTNEQTALNLKESLQCP